MTGWLIFGGIILFILGILMVPVHIAVDYKEELSLSFRFLFFYIKYDRNSEKGKNEKTEKKEKKTSVNKEKSPGKQKKKRTLEENIDMVIDIINKYGPGAKMILKNIRIHRLELYWKVGAEDAAACGIKYGRICAWISGVLGFFRNLMKIEKIKLRVFPDFICEKDEIYGGADFQFNPLIVIIGALRMGIVFIKDMMKNKPKTKSAKPRHDIKTKESALK